MKIRVRGTIMIFKETILNKEIFWSPSWKTYSIVERYDFVSYSPDFGCIWRSYRLRSLRWLGRLGLLLILVRKQSFSCMQISRNLTNIILCRAWVTFSRFSELWLFSFFDILAITGWYLSSNLVLLNWCKSRLSAMYRHSRVIITSVDDRIFSRAIEWSY